MLLSRIHAPIAPAERKAFFLVRTDLYDDSMEYYIDLTGMVMLDYPNLSLKEIKAQELGGDTHRGKRCIEWQMPYSEDMIHPEYRKVCSFALYPHK